MHCSIINPILSGSAAFFASDISLSNNAKKMLSLNGNVTTIGFGTAALGSSCFNAVTWALESGFRRFDTAEERDYWYDQECVGRALQSYFQQQQRQNNQLLLTCQNQDTTQTAGDPVTCSNTIEWPPTIFDIDTKIPPWELTSMNHIRQRAASSRKTLVGFLDTDDFKYPLDIYYIHAPTCWSGWHPRCDEISTDTLLSLREAWMAMEAVVGLDQSARRIGLSNVSPEELLDIIAFVNERLENGEYLSSSSLPTPRYPDVLQTFADPLFPSKELHQICQQYGIQFVSYSTLGTQHEGHNIRNLNNPVLDDPRIHRLAKKYEKSTAEVVLSWAIQRNMSVIPRSTKLLHIQQLANLLTNARFVSKSDLQRIDGLEMN